MRQAEQRRQRSWKISVHAEFKNFNFRLKATKISPTWKFHRFSMLLKLQNFLLHLRSDSGSPPFPTHQRPTLKSRFLAAVHKLRPRRSKNHPVTEVNSPINRLKHFAHKEPVWKGSMVGGILAFLFRSIFEEDPRGIIVLSSILLFCFAVLPKKNISEQSRTLVLTLLVVTIVIAVAVCSGLDHRSLNYEYHHLQGWISEFVWKAMHGTKSICCNIFNNDD